MFASLPYTSSDGSPVDASTTRVILYGLSSCAHCAEAKAFLQESGVPFAMTYLDTLAPEVRRPVLHAFREHHGRRVLYPVLEVDGEFTYGFDREAWQDVLARVHDGE